MPHLKRTAKYSIQEVFQAIKDGHNQVYLTGTNQSIDLTSLRIKNFYQHGIACVSCGIIGQFFASEVTTSSDDYADMKHHLNLYALDENGKEVLMTKDHILAKSSGGKDSIDNMQPMCCLCNSAKSNLPIELLKEHKIVDDNGKFIIHNKNSKRMRDLSSRISRNKSLTFKPH